MKRTSFFSLLALAVAALAFATACDDSASPASPSVTPAVGASAGPFDASSSGPSSSLAPAGEARSNQAAGPVRLRVAHLSTDAPPVDVWVNGAVVLSNVPYKTVSGYLDLPAGEYRIQVTPAGAPAPVVIDATVPLAAGSVYTAAAVGFLSSDSLVPLVLLDDLSLGSGARIRLVHASADTGAVDVAVAGGPVLFSGVTFQEASAYIEVPAGTYDLEVRPAGDSVVALSIPGLSVAGGKTYTVFAVGRSFNRTLAALPVVDAP